jgi:RNase P subunit RPR2
VLELPVNEGNEMSIVTRLCDGCGWNLIRYNYERDHTGSWALAASNSVG